MKMWSASVSPLLDAASTSELDEHSVHRIWLSSCISADSNPDKYIFSSMLCSSDWLQLCQRTPELTSFRFFSTSPKRPSENVSRIVQCYSPDILRKHSPKALDNSQLYLFSATMFLWGRAGPVSKSPSRTRSPGSELTALNRLAISHAFIAVHDGRPDVSGIRSD